jgi:chromosome partitioning protein
VSENLGIIWTIAAQKGGEGKSTLVTNIIIYFLLEGLKVALVDADRQGTCKNWSDDRKGNKKLKSVDTFSVYGEKIQDKLKELRKEYDVVVVDVAGHDSTEMRAALLASKLVIIPVLCSQPDLDTMPKMEKIVKDAKKINKNLKTFLLLSRTPTNPRIKEVREAIEFLADFDLKLLKSKIAERKVFRDAISKGISVFEVKDKKNKGALEMEKFIKEVVNGI